MNERLYQLRGLFEKYERRISSIFLVGGFIFDSLTIQRIDRPFDHLVILSYLMLSGASIILLNKYHERPPISNFSIWVRNLLLPFIQFALGGLFSVFLVFYSRSTSISASWPFLLLLLFLLVGNEFFRNYYERLTFQLSIYYIAIFSFSILIVPVLLKKMNAGVFLLSGLVSLVFITFFTRILFRMVPQLYHQSRVDINRMITLLFLVINILYFTNLIPPIPLAMKNSGIYHLVTKMDNNYEVVGEKRDWYGWLPSLSPLTVHLNEGEPLYAFGAVFAPTGLNTDVIHDWQYFDKAADKWVSATKVTFNIFGGRGEGYRTFSKKENLFYGQWRVDVKTESGQIIGRLRFNIVPVSSKPMLYEKIL